MFAQRAIQKRRTAMASNTTETVALFGTCSSVEIHSEAATLTRPIARKTRHATNAARNIGAVGERSANSAGPTALWVLRAMVTATAILVPAVMRVAMTVAIH